MFKNIYVYFSNNVSFIRNNFFKKIELRDVIMKLKKLFKIIFCDNLNKILLS